MQPKQLQTQSNAARTVRVRTVTRKEIAAAVEMSEDTVARRAKEWGLDKCSSVASRRPVIFFRDLASEVLIRRGLLTKPL